MKMEGMKMIGGMGALAAAFRSKNRAADEAPAESKVGPADYSRGARYARRSEAAHRRKMNRRYRKRMTREAYDRDTLLAQLAILEGEVEVPEAVFHNVRKAVQARLASEGKLEEALGG